MEGKKYLRSKEDIKAITALGVLGSLLTSTGIMVYNQFNNDEYTKSNNLFKQPPTDSTIKHKDAIIHKEIVKKGKK